MNKEQIQKAVEELQKQPARKFTQSYDLIINLKDLVLSQNPVDVFVTLPFQQGKKVKVAAFVDQQLAGSAEKCCDAVIKENDFVKYANKKELKKLAESYDYFIAQANLMPKIAATFGKALGTKGKMPNPKLGCVVPPTANLDLLVKRLNVTVRLTTKKGLNLQCLIGKENQPAAEIIENILAIYNTVVKQLPNESQNIKNILLKRTMGTPVRM
ncbi:MAG: 50S ribosomal protein L1 [Nanoarchaeota archaeon]|nr:50S ribosomal protein L1 [Nanoarchaeota archaeon]